MLSIQIKMIKYTKLKFYDTNKYFWIKNFDSTTKNENGKVWLSKKGSSMAVCTIVYIEIEIFKIWFW